MRRCRECGCSELDACEDPETPTGTCAWVEWDLCSTCAGMVPVDRLDAEEIARLFDVGVEMMPTMRPRR